MDTESKNPENETSIAQPSDTIITRVAKDLKYLLIEYSILIVFLSTIAGIITSVTSTVFLIQKENYVIIPDEYLALIITIVSVLVGICTMVFLIFLMYKKQQTQKLSIIKKIREKEKNLLNDIDKRIGAILK